MTQKALCELLSSTGYPVAYNEFIKAPTVPYIAFLFRGEQQHGSDFKNLIKSRTVVVELYTEYKDTDAESKLDSLLSFVEFNKSKDKLSEEKLILISYEFEDIEKI